MEECVAVFARVEETATASPVCFRQDDLDWFVVEAYNRGTTLTYYGDEFNSER